MSDKLKDREERKTSPFGFTIDQRTTYGSRTSYATVVYYHYNRQNLLGPTNTASNFSGDFLATTRGVIEEDIRSVKVNKSIDDSPGTFSITLLPSKNWKRFISPGDWMIIYIHPHWGDTDKYKSFDGEFDSKQTIMLCNVDRVSRSLQKNEDNDKTELRYNVDGRGFAKVFAECDIWYDQYSTQRETLNRVILPNAGLEIQGSPSVMVDTLIDVFLGKGANFATGRTSDLNNWKIPLSLMQVFKLNSSAEVPNQKFWDILDKNIEENLPGFKQRQMLTLNSNGSLLDLLKRCSNDLVNELYFEDARDTSGNVRPTVFLKPRPICTPFFGDHMGTDIFEVEQIIKPLLKNKIKTLQQQANESFIEISPAEILFENLGKDEHSRFNLFWLKPINGYEHIYAYASNLNETNKISNPTFNGSSIERHGLKRFDQVLEFCHTTGTGGEQGQVTPEINLWKSFMIQLYDMHFANHLYDAGTIECSGVLEAELGKALVVKSQSDIVPDKVYYIEGYEHEWTFPNKWTTTFTVSHGQWKVPTGKNIFIDVDPLEFGQFDETISNSYTARTVTDKEKVSR